MKNLRKMTAIATLALTVVLIATPALHGDEVSAVWSRLYNRARSIEDRIMIMSGLVEVDDPAIVASLGSALQQLNETRENEMSVTEKMLRVELTKMIVGRLGDYRAAEYSDLIFDVFRNEKDTYLRAEAALLFLFPSYRNSRIFPGDEEGPVIKTCRFPLAAAKKRSLLGFMVREQVIMADRVGRPTR